MWPFGKPRRPKEGGRGNDSEERRLMVEHQIRARGVRDDCVLRAMEKIPRHLFVPDEARSSAYADEPLPIGLGQTISQPYIVAFMTEALGLKGEERVLEIGTGSGYQAAVLAECAARIYTVEVIESLSRRARRVLHDLGYRNIEYRVGDGSEGWPDEAPFDAVIVTAAAARIPEKLEHQLKPGGRMIIPVGGGYHQELRRIDRTDTGFRRDNLLAVRFVPLVSPGPGKPETEDEP